MTDNGESTDNEKGLVEELKLVFGSGHINFLFGAGVNGEAFPNFANGFNETKEALKNKGQKGLNIENELKELGLDEYNEVTSIFIKEFNDCKVKNCDSLENFKNLLCKVYELTERIENRQPQTKKINVFTLNYDRIVESILDDQCYFYNSITAKKMKGASTLDIIGYDSVRRKYVPTFAISKLHGSIPSNGVLKKEDIIMPSISKEDKALSGDFFGVLFKMRSELEKRNAVLFVIGYSGADEHVNKIVLECVELGLRVYWLKYREEKGIAEEKYADKVRFILPIKVEGEYVKQDATKRLFDLMNGV